MIIIMFANKIKTDEPARIYYAAAIEFLTVDMLAIRLIVRLMAGS